MAGMKVTVEIEVETTTQEVLATGAEINGRTVDTSDMDRQLFSQLVHALQIQFLLED